MLPLIDGDGLVYRCGFAVEKTKYLVTHVPSDKEGEYDVLAYFCNTHKEAKEFVEKEIKRCGLDKPGNIWSRKEVEPVENALALVKGALSSIYDQFNSTGPGEIWLTPSVGNFRDRIAVSAKYKGNRETVARPIYYKEIISYLKDVYKADTAIGEEADDRLGIRATELGKGGVIVSFDKDLDQVPGMHYNWVTKELYEITPKQAALNFFRQILSGDPVDNVPGLPGIGPAKAERALDGVKGPKEAWEVALEMYKSAFGPEEGLNRALETARLVWVRRKDGELWQPPA